jgi:hypothetical protein
VTAELAVVVAVGLAVAFARSVGQWWACRTPIGVVNVELARARRRRQ